MITETRALPLEKSSNGLLQTETLGKCLLLGLLNNIGKVNSGFPITSLNSSMKITELNTFQTFGVGLNWTEVMPPAFKHHHMIEVVKLHQSETWLGSHSKLYDRLDRNSVQKGTDSKGNPIMQPAHVHEIGHLLGFGHVVEDKPHCPPTSTNSSACYGISDRDKNSVMGQGMQLRKEHSAPWRKAVVGLLNKGNMQLSTDWEAKLQRHYPRTHAEIKAKKSITIKPNRT